MDQYLRNVLILYRFYSVWEHKWHKMLSIISVMIDTCLLNIIIIFKLRVTYNLSIIRFPDIGK